MDIHGAGDGADRTGPDAVLPRRLERALAQARMRGQSQIVVRRKIDDGAVIERRLRFLFVFENAKLAVQPLSFERRQLRREVRERIASHAGIGQPFAMKVLVKSAISP